MNGPLVSLAILLGGGSWFAFWVAKNRAKTGNVHKWERAGAAVACLAAFVGMIGLDGVFAGAWADAGKGAGLLFLILVTLGAGTLGVMAIAKGWMHNKHSTLALGVITGVVIALWWGGWATIKTNSAAYVASAGHGLTHAASGKTGVTAGHHTATAGGGGAWGILLIVLVIAALLIVVIRQHRGGKVKDVVVPVAALTP